MSRTPRVPGDLFGIASGPATRCRLCGKSLSTPASIARGIGPECARLAGIDTTNPTDVSDHFADIANGKPLEHSAFIDREPDPDGNGRVRTNVPHLVCHHSPTGFEFGYTGSGPADLALNICEHVARATKLDDGTPVAKIGQPVRCSVDGTASGVAYAAHQRVKAFVAAIPPEGGQIPLAAVAVALKEEAERMRRDARAFPQD